MIYHGHDLYTLRTLRTLLPEKFFITAVFGLRTLRTLRTLLFRKVLAKRWHLRTLRTALRTLKKGYVCADLVL